MGARLHRHHPDGGITGITQWNDLDCHSQLEARNAALEEDEFHQQLLLRPLSVRHSEEPADVQLVEAFAPACAPGDGATAFGRSWLKFAQLQRERAFVARQRSRQI